MATTIQMYCHISIIHKNKAHSMKPMPPKIEKDQKAIFFFQKNQLLEMNVMKIF